MKYFWHVSIALTAAFAGNPRPICAGDGPATALQQALTLEQADRLRVTGDYVSAIEAYERLVDVKRNAVAAACGISACRVLTGDLEGARHALERVADDGDSSPSWHRAMGRLSELRGSYEEALDHCRKAVEFDRRDFQARLAIGRILETVGRRDKAIEAYAFFDKVMTQRLPEDAPSLTALGQGFLRYSVLSKHPNLSNRTIHVLQEIFQPAYELVDRSYWPARLAAADLLRSKFKQEEAEEDYRAALAINANLADARLGLGWLALDSWNFEQVETELQKARVSNPRSTSAWRLEAALLLTERHYADAREAAQAALEVNPRDVEALGYAAAAAYAMNDDQAVDGFERRARSVSATPSAFHRIMGDTLGALRQYAVSQRQYELAIQGDPTDPHPRTELGLMYMQWGKEAEARTALEAAWRLDEFDARTHNVLELLETLASFERLESEHFVIKYQDGPDAIPARYMSRYLESIYDELVDDFDVQLPQKTIIEVLPTHRLFGVRITGKPWIHTVGACTGWVIALDSPRSTPQLRGPYNYARVLRHEFTHTVTLAASENRIPHWFTEGLAVMQEDAPRSFDWRRLLAETIRRDDLFTLKTLDWGFIRPRKPTDRSLAYAQSEWMCEFIVHRFGYGSINRMIAGFRERMPQEEVLQKVLGLSQEAFDEAFATWARGEANEWGFDLSAPEDASELRAKIVADNDDAALHGRLARAELDAGNVDEALAAARRGIELDERNPRSLTVLGELLWELRSQAGPDEAKKAEIDGELLPAMRRLAEIDQRSWIAPAVIGQWALERRDFELAVKQFDRLHGVCPDDPTSDRGLAGVFLEQERYDQARPHLLDLAATDEHDAQIPATLGMSYAREGKLGEARYWYGQSILVDPFDPATHDALATIDMRMNDTRAAAEEYAMLCVLQPQVIDYFEKAATAYHKLGDTAAAQRYAQEAVKLDPDSSAKMLLSP